MLGSDDVSVGSSVGVSVLVDVVDSVGDDSVVEDSVVDESVVEDSVDDSVDDEVLVDDSDDDDSDDDPDVGGSVLVMFSWLVFSSGSSQFGLPNRQMGSLMIVPQPGWPNTQ